MAVDVDADIRRLRHEEITTLVEDLWRPFAEEMAALDAYNELAEDVHEPAVAYRTERYADDDIATFVAVKDAFVGYTTVSYDTTPPVFTRGPVANIDEVYVRPEHRGDGIATALMNRAERWSRERGCERVTLSVNAANEAAIGLYEQREYAVRRYKMYKSLEAAADAGTDATTDGEAVDVTDAERDGERE